MSEAQPKSISRKRATVLQAIGGYANIGIVIVQGLLLVPMSIHFIGLHLYGLWLASGGIIAMLGILNMGVGTLLTQRVAQAYGKQDLHKAASDFSNGFATYCILTAAFTGLGVLFSYNLSSLLKEVGPDEVLLRDCFQLALIATAISLVNECFRAFAQALLRPLYLSIALAGARLSGLVMTVSLLYGGAGLRAIPEGLLFSEAIALAFGILQSAALFRELGSSFQLSAERIKEYFSLGGLLFLSRLGSALSRDADPLLISFFFKPELTAAYMVMRRAADVVFQLMSVINSSMFGSFSHLVGTGNKAKIGSVAAKLLTLSVLVGLVGYVAYVALNSSFVKLWVGQIFVLDQQMILYIGVAYFLNSLRNMVLQLLNGLGEFRMTSFVVIFEGVAKFVLVVFLLSWLGVQGVPLSLAAVSLGTLIFAGISLYKRIAIPIAPNQFTKVIAICGFLFSLAAVLPSILVANFWWQFVLLLIICIVVILALLILLNLKEIKTLRRTYLE